MKDAHFIPGQNKISQQNTVLPDVANLINPFMSSGLFYHN